jgi:hypothetical protein
MKQGAVRAMGTAPAAAGGGRGLAQQRKLFVGVTPGLERLLLDELSSLPGLRTGKHSVNWHPHDGGLEGMVANEELWAIAWKSR